jgi:hypothetical protein
MARADDFACAIAIGPASAVVAIVVALLTALLGGVTADVASLVGTALFVLVPPATIVLRARVRGLALDWTCLLVLLTLVSMAATVGAVIIALSLVYAHFMGDF